MPPFSFLPELSPIAASTDAALLEEPLAGHSVESVVRCYWVILPGGRRVRRCRAV